MPPVKPESPITKSASYVKPRASTTVPPGNIPYDSFRERTPETFSDYTFEWALYRTKGRSINDYAEVSEKYRTRSLNPKRYPEHAAARQRISEGDLDGSLVVDTKIPYPKDRWKHEFRMRSRQKKEYLGRVAEARQWHHPDDITLDSFSRLLHWFPAPGKLANYIIFNSEVYRNIALLWFVYFNFYFQEYVYVTLSMYFPVLDWFILQSLLMWPIHIDLFFARFVGATLFIFLFVSSFFQYYLGLYTKLDRAVIIFNYTWTFALALGYYWTGLVPFVIGLLFPVFLFIPYSLYFLVPRVRTINYAPPPQLYLPAPPKKAPLLCLPIYRYRYPFQIYASRSIVFKQFTAFPFTTNVAKTAAHHRFLRSVFIHSNFNGLARRFPSILNTQLSSFPIVVPRSQDIESYYPDENPHRNQRRLRWDANQDMDEFVVSTTPYFRDADPLMALHPGYEDLVELKEVEDTYFYNLDLSKVSNNENWGPSFDNITLFGTSMRELEARRSLARRSFDNESDTFGQMQGPRPPLWQLALLKDPYFELYIWLQCIAPRSRQGTIKSKFAKVFALDYSGHHDRGTVPYPSLTKFFHFFYNLAEFFFDMVTRYRFIRLVGYKDSFSEFYYQLARFSARADRFGFRPNRFVVKDFIKALLFLERCLDSSSDFIRPLKHSMSLRFELIHIIGRGTSLISAHYISYFPTAVGGVEGLGLRVLTRVSDRVLLKLSLLVETEHPVSLFDYFLLFALTKKMRFWSKNTVFQIIDQLFVKHKSPIFLGYLWNFGVFSFVCLFAQIITGLFLAMHYIPDTAQAFDSVEHIMRNVNNGWFLRYAHANGASFFFIAVYIHIFRGLYYGSFTNPRQAVWYIGSVILLLMIVTAFLGYVLPWGQMSYWAATVITNMLSAVPFVGTNLVSWVWGGYSVGGPTLTRFYALHFIFPLILVVLVFYHIYLLHKHGSSNPLGIEAGIDDKPFYPYYIVKDIFAIVLFFFPFAFMIFFYPNALGHPDNYIPANPLVTPSHIVPEWYFLPFYAILRSVPDKVFGVFLMVFAIVSLALVPAVQKPNLRSMEFRPVSRFLFWWFLYCCVVLGWIGSQVAKFPYVEIGQYATAFFFFYFWVIMPIVIFVENRFGGPKLGLKKNTRFSA